MHVNHNDLPIMHETTYLSNYTYIVGTRARFGSNKEYGLLSSLVHQSPFSVHQAYVHSSSKNLFNRSIFSCFVRVVVEGCVAIRLSFTKKLLFQ